MELDRLIEIVLQGMLEADRDTAQVGEAVTNECELASRMALRALRSGDNVLIVAEGELPSPGYEVDVAQSLIPIFPPQFNLLRCALPGIFPQVITPYTYSETVRYPADQPHITVHHADGADEVAIEECGRQLAPYVEVVRGHDGDCPEGADQAVGFSKSLSFDEAFADAVAKLPPLTPAHPDTLVTIRVLETGALFGGIAGFRDLYVRVCRTHD